MAGAGYKLFNTGDVLTAAQVNTYLMEQTVMVFADAAARTAALSGVVSEGMISYLKDTNAVEVYNGSAWVASDDPNAIQNTIVDAKGDLISASAADTPARLAVGNNGETLVADSSASTGLRWQGVNTGNFAHNGAFDIWQRGTSFTSSGAYTADRWYNYFGSGTFTISRTTSNIPTGFQYGLNIASSGTTASLGMYQAMETANAILLAGQTVTVSAWVRSSNSGTFTINLGQSSNTDEGQSGTYSNCTASGNSWSSTTTSTRFSAQFTVPSTAKSLRLEISTPSLASGASATLTGVQIEIGSTATAFRRMGGNIAGEYTACARYYQKSYALGTAPGSASNDGFVYSAGNNVGTSTGYLGAQVVFPVKMRTTPTFTTYDAAYASGKVSRVTPGGTDQNGISPTSTLANDSAILILSVTGNAHSGLAFHYTASAEL